MLILALIFVILAIAFAGFEFLKSVYTNFIALAIALLSTGIALWIVDILHAQGKF